MRAPAKIARPGPGGTPARSKTTAFIVKAATNGTAETKTGKSSRRRAWLAHAKRRRQEEEQPDAPGRLQHTLDVVKGLGDTCGAWTANAGLTGHAAAQVRYTAEPQHVGDTKISGSSPTTKVARASPMHDPGRSGEA